MAELQHIEPIDRVIARRLAMAREDADLVKTEVAEKLGITKQGYTPYERGEHSFTVGEVMKLARITGRPVEWFLDLKCNDLSEDEQRVLQPFRQIKNKALRQMVIEQVRAAAGVPAEGEGNGSPIPPRRPRDEDGEEE